MVLKLNIDQIYDNSGVKVAVIGIVVVFSVVE